MHSLIFDRPALTEFDVEILIATTSGHLKNGTREDNSCALEALKATQFY